LFSGLGPLLEDRILCATFFAATTAMYKPKPPSANHPATCGRRPSDAPQHSVAQQHIGQPTVTVTTVVTVLVTVTVPVVS
jgi:hypothetical protein